MTKAEIQAFIDQQDRKADKNYGSYQETGDRRYLRAYEQAEDLAELARRALNAADEHEDYIWLRASVAELCLRAELAMTTNDSFGGVIRDLLAVGRAHGVYSMKGEPHG